VTRTALALAAIALAGAACSDRDKPAVKRESERPRRVMIDPPAQGVRALPPHAIRADGAGPYKLGATAAELLDQLPSGPRIRQFAIPGIVQRDMLRGEDDAILIGTEPQGRATFVAVVRDEIARTESGIQVGSTRSELEQALGPALDEVDRARDPRIVIPSKLENAHVVMSGDRIAAIVLTPAAPSGADRVAPDHTCARPAGDRSRGVIGVCLTLGGELLRPGNDELAVLGRDGEKAIATARIPGLVFAAPLRHGTEARDDVVAITHADEPDSRTWSVTVFRMIDGNLVAVVKTTPVVQLSAANARWIGADLRDLDLLLELAARPDSIEVGGLLTVRQADAIRDIVVISSVTVARRGRAKLVATEPHDAGTSDGPTAQDPAESEHPSP
jgi:hypothetical protein